MTRTTPSGSKPRERPTPVGRGKRVGRTTTMRYLGAVWFASIFVAMMFAVALVFGASGSRSMAATPNHSSSDSSSADGRDGLPPIDHRFAEPDVDEIPDFQRHVIPLLGRLGCNGRSCHGSFQGRGDFQLSLFGYDFAADHAALMEADRVVVDDPLESLILAKPVDADVHGGGKRFDADSWQANVLRRWIEAGAAPHSAPAAKLQTLQITPPEIRFGDDVGAPVRLMVRAVWEDGTVEDVTPLCRFRTNDESVASVDPSGRVRGHDTGDTHVVVFYDNAVCCVPVMRPTSDRRVRPTSDHPIDVLVARQLDKLGIPQSPSCTDAEFLRRATLDVTGLLPTETEVREFLADTRPDRRIRLVDRLLDSPAHAQWWATKFSDWTGNNAEQLQNSLPVRNVAGKLWHRWVARRLADNVPYDEIVAGIVTARSREPGEDYRSFCEAMTGACRPGGEDRFAERSSMPLYWMRRDFQKPEEKAVGFAYSFLAVRIECAQCHKHPFDRWSKDDFDQFARLFAPIRGSGRQVEPENRKAQQELLTGITGGEKLRGGELRRKVAAAARRGGVVPFGEILVTRDRQPARRNRRPDSGGRPGSGGRPVPTGRILGDRSIPIDDDPRGPLMDWLRDPANPHFAPAIVNRVWANYFGIGLVDPTDDMNLANPPSNAALLKHLSDEFIAHDFDLRWLHRHITSSDAYARSADSVPGNENDRRHFSRHVPHRLPAEVIRDAVSLALASDDENDRLRGDPELLAIGDRGVTQRRPEFALTVFGKSTRQSNCDCDRSDEPSLLQSVYLRNDDDIHRALVDKKGWVTQRCRELGAPPPTVGGGGQQSKAERALEQRRRSFLKQVRRVAAMPEPARRKNTKRIGAEYDRLAKKAAQYNLDVPPLDAIMDDPDVWTADYRSDSGATDGSVTPDRVRETIRSAYLRTLSRMPDEEELAVASKFLSGSDTFADGLTSLMWTLVNTKEFLLTH